MKIEIKCTGTTTLALEEIQRFQGDLKKLSAKNLEKLKQSIIKRGFCAAIFLWDCDGIYKILDGTQRSIALESLQKDGYEIPPLPVVFIDAENEKEAKDKLLAISSQFGTFDMSELESWIADLDEDILESIRLVGDEINFDDVLPEEEFIDETDTEDNERSYQEIARLTVHATTEELLAIYEDLKNKGFQCKLEKKYN
jgi:ParB-like chromosome segregation protein Spo0J